MTTTKKYAYVKTSDSNAPIWKKALTLTECLTGIHLSSEELIKQLKLKIKNRNKQIESLRRDKYILEAWNIELLRTLKEKAPETFDEDCRIKLQPTNISNAK